MADSGRSRAHANSWGPDAAGEMYERGRPGYPAGVIELLAHHLVLGPDSRIADVAAGTGKLTRELSAGGAGAVFAIEPMAGMRTQLARNVPGATVLAGTAERLPLATGSVDGVTVAQAFHWFHVAEAARELARVLRPGGSLALVNNRPHHTSPWQEQLWATLRRYERLAPRPNEAPGWRQALDETGVFEPFARFELPHEQRFEGVYDLDDRFGSISHVLLLDPAVRQSLMDELHATVAGVEPLVITMTTVVEVAVVAR